MGAEAAKMETRAVRSPDGKGWILNGEKLWCTNGTKAELIAMLKQRGDVTAAWIETLSDDFLGETFNQPPGATPATKTPFEMVMSKKQHDMHQWAQLKLIQPTSGEVEQHTATVQER